MPLPAELRDRVYAWVADDPEAATAREALALIAAEDAAQLSDRFDTQLEFGTAGLRGLLGAGPNRMNRAVVRRTTAGLCAYLLREVKNARARGVVIGRDGRHGSDVFASDAAQVAMGMGFVVHYFNELASTPLVSYATQDLGAAGGVMVTASHNPPEYNGYKVYWENSAQIIPPHDAGIAKAIAEVGSTKDIPLVNLHAGRELGLFRPVPREVEEHYFRDVAALRFEATEDRSLSIAYTPMHGVGLPFAMRAFADGGFKNVHVVEKQAKPDGDFPTVKFPNPEEPGAMDLLLALAAERQTDIALANDPDADRLAVAYRARDGKYVTLTGNQIGVLLGYHRIIDDPHPRPHRLVISTIVSTPELGVIARRLGVQYEETLTGFKWITNTALALEASAGASFIFGFEEALGCTVGDLVRDKDGVSGAVVCAHLAAALKAKGQTLGDRLDEIAREYGVYRSRQHSISDPGAAGAARIKAIMAALRKNTPWKVGAVAVHSVRDYERGLVLTQGGSSKLDSHSANVLVFDLEGGARIIVRPSGTEPKIKFYFDVRAVPGVGESLDSARARGTAQMDEFQRDFLALVDAAAH